MGFVIQKVNSLDTNVVLRFLLNDIPVQTSKARRLISSSQVYVSDVVVTETVYVLEQTLKYDRSFISGLLRMFLSLPQLSHNDHILPDAISLFEKRSALSFVDCYAAMEAKVFGAKLYTFDKKLIKQGGAHIEAA